MRWLTLRADIIWAEVFKGYRRCIDISAVCKSQLSSLWLYTGQTAWPVRMANAGSKHWAPSQGIFQYHALRCKSCCIYNPHTLHPETQCIPNRVGNMYCTMETVVGTESRPAQMWVAFSFWAAVSFLPKRGGAFFFGSRLTLTVSFAPFTCTTQLFL